MFRRSLALRGGDFRSAVKVGDAFSTVTNRQGWSFDHVAIDVGTITGAAGRITKDLLGQERDTECIRFVQKQIFNVIMKRMTAKKSLALFIDGSEPLWRLRRSRRFPGKKSEGKFYRSCASPMVFALEDKLRASVPDMNRCPAEFLVSGPATPGTAEHKLSSWLLDLSCRADVSLNDTIALVGGPDTFLTALGATPFHNITTVLLNQGEVQGLSLQESLEWLCADHLLKAVSSAGSSEEAKRSAQTRLAKTRTDIVLLYLLSNGMSATDLNGLGVGFKDLMEQYLLMQAGSSSQLFTGPEDPAQASSGLLGLDCAAVEGLLSRATRRAASARSSPVAADYLEIALQTHAMVCLGGVRNYGFVPQEELVEKPPAANPGDVIGHLKFLAQQKLKSGCPTGPALLVPTVNRNFALTAAESLMLSSASAPVIEQILPAFAGGHTLPSETAHDIVNTVDALEALEKIRCTLRPVIESAAVAHRALQHYPAHLWRRKPGCAGPPPGWEYRSVNVGVIQQMRNIRSELITGAGRRGSEPPTDMLLAKSQSSAKNVLVEFLQPANDDDDAGPSWIEAACDAGNSARGPHPSTLRVVTWNVQFSRHSGERTPLGKPGIDWCTSTRYVALSHELSETDADVIAMQETEPAWQEFLSKQPWVRSNYRFSCGPSGEAINPWGVLLLIHKRVRVMSVANANVPGYTGHVNIMPTITVEIAQGVPLTVSACHLLAPYNTANLSNRVTQLEALIKRVSAKVVGLESLVLGDFNDYPDNFFTMPSSEGYKDAWLALHPDEGLKGRDEAGYTIHGGKNSYAELLIETQFFGRADRVLLRSTHLQPVEARLIGTASVTSLLESGAIRLQPSDKCPPYLFPSDHFGVFIEMQVV
jgi:endonuclease/exonuclease/phosphatase family metal-dependent hydrolase